MCFMIFFFEKTPFLAIKTKCWKSRQLEIFPNWLPSMVLVQNWPFFHRFFVGNLGQENVFYDILERKNAILFYKNKKLKTSKNWYGFKGVSPWFWSKIGHFSIFVFLGNLSQENVFYDILERKNAFLCYTNNELKKSKNWVFFKGVSPWFWSKIGNFSSSLFKAI